MSTEAPQPEITTEPDAQPEAPAADSTPAPAITIDPTAPDPTAPDPAALAPAIEAALLSFERPIGHERLAVALGLVAPDPEDDAPPPPTAPAPATDAAEEPAPEAETASVKRRGRAGAAIKARREALSKASQVIDAAIASLNESYAATGRSFRIEQVSGGFRVMTLPAHASVVAALHKQRTQTKLTKAAVETLAIIAYKQPMTRAQLEAIRGVACGEVLRSLMDRRLITIRGRAEELGRPILYGTSKQFLDHFGLASISDLPTLTELKPV